MFISIRRSTNSLRSLVNLVIGGARSFVPCFLRSVEDKSSVSKLYENKPGKMGKCSAIQPQISDDPSVDPLKRPLISEPGAITEEEPKQEETLQILPKIAQPSHYHLELYPALPGDKFHGIVKIYLQLKEDTNKLELNSRELIIESVKFSPLYGNQSNENYLNCDFYTSDKDERMYVNFAQKYKKNTNGVLKITYTGHHGAVMSGFYKSTYRTDREEKYMYSTQFEPNDCSRALPCWDEPIYKATFDVVIYAPEQYTVLSNMPEIKEQSRKVVETEHGQMVSHVFERTPKMSTYLLAFVVCDDLVSSVKNITIPVKQSDGTVKDEKIPCSIYYNSHLKDESEYPIEVAEKSLVFFSELFDFPYPLPKSDHVAIPEFAFGAMENWGLITYREAALLMNKERIDPIRALNAIITISHELSHQWFGNLVTMKWWNDLWLNEAFATYFSYYFVSKVYPDYPGFEDMVNDLVVTGMEVDSKLNSHPVSVPIYKSSSAIQIFDEISYHKGSAIVRMLCTYIGDEAFKLGLRQYFAENQYKNAETRDLWNAFKSSSGYDVEGFMNNWITKPGFPFVKVVGTTYNQEKKLLSIAVKQHRFISGNSIIDDEKNSTIWSVPLNLMLYKKGQKPVVFRDLLLTQREGTFSVQYEPSDDTFWKLNSDYTGFYHSVHPEECHNGLIRAIKEDSWDDIGINNIINFIHDSFVMSTAGYNTLPFSKTLDLIKSVAEAYKTKENYKITYVLPSTVRRVILFEIVPQLYRYSKTLPQQARRLLSECFGNWVEENETFSAGHLPEKQRIPFLLFQASVYSLLVSARYKPAIDKLLVLFEKYVAAGFDDTVLPSHIVGTILETGFKFHKDRETLFYKVLDHQYNIKTPSVRSVTVRALAGVKSDKIRAEMLDGKILDGKTVRIQDVTTFFSQLISSIDDTQKEHDVSWEFINKNWDKLAEMFPDSTSVSVGSLIARAFSGVNGQDIVKKLKDWIAGKDLEGTPEYEKTWESRKKMLEYISFSVTTTLDTLKSETIWVEKFAPEIIAWFDKN